MATARRLLVSRAEMARKLGVTGGTVTKACREGGRLAKACSGRGVNVLHPAARGWLAERAALARARDLEAAENGEGIPVDDPGDPGERDDDEGDGPPTTPAAGRPGATETSTWDGKLADLEEPLATVTEHYGTAPAFAGWIRCRKSLEEARKAEMLRERVEGRLIARTTVVRMLDHLDVAFRLLLTDAPRSIATRLGVADVAEAARVVRDVMSQHLVAARDHMTASLDADDPTAPLMEAAE